MGSEEYEIRVKHGKPPSEKDWMILDDVNLEAADFSGRTLKLGLTVRGRSSFTRCTFEKMRIGDATFGTYPQAVYTECSFDRSRMGMRTAGNARFVRCSFRDVRIKPLFGWELEFIDCVFSGRIEQATFWGLLSKDDQAKCGRTRNAFEGNDFSGADLVDVAFRDGIDLTRNKLPDSPDHLIILDGRAALARVRKRVFEMPDSKLRDAALIWVKTKDANLRGEPDHLFMRRINERSAFDRAHNLVFDLLKEESEAIWRP
ncbi:MAG: hypothetical protein AB2L09_01265 [Coriobacteriia bacterium]